MALPSAFKELMLFAWISDKAASWFDDDSVATKAMRGHLFWASLAFGGTLGVHLLGLGLVWCCGLRGDRIPGILRLPQIEIKLALALAMGTLDSAIAVLCTRKASIGWHAVAAAEVFFLFVFVGWFWRQSVLFTRNAQWTPLANVTRRRSGDTHPSGDTDAFLSEAEVLKIAKEIGMSKHAGKALFKGLDKDGNGVLNYSEFCVLFSENKSPQLVKDALAAKGRRPADRVVWQRSTAKEGLVALATAPRCEAGKWLPSDSTADINEPYGRHFITFTPRHVSYYPMGIVRQLITVSAINALAPWGTLQLVALCVVEFGSFLSIALYAPYVLLAETRSECMSYLLRFAAHVAALLGVVGVLPGHQTSAVMIGSLSVAMLQNIFTQIYPMIGSYLDILKVVLCLENDKKDKKRKDALANLLFEDEDQAALKGPQLHRRVKVACENDEEEYTVEVLLQLEGFAPNLQQGGSGQPFYAGPVDKTTGIDLEDQAGGAGSGEDALALKDGARVVQAALARAVDFVLSEGPLAAAAQGYRRGVRHGLWAEAQAHVAVSKGGAAAAAEAAAAAARHAFIEAQAAADEAEAAAARARAAAENAGGSSGVGPGEEEGEEEKDLAAAVVWAAAFLESKASLGVRAKPLAVALAGRGFVGRCGLARLNAEVSDAALVKDFKLLLLDVRKLRRAVAKGLESGEFCVGPAEAVALSPAGGHTRRAQDAADAAEKAHAQGRGLALGALGSDDGGLDQGVRPHGSLAPPPDGATEAHSQQALLKHATAANKAKTAAAVAKQALDAAMATASATREAAAAGRGHGLPLEVAAELVAAEWAASAGDGDARAVVLSPGATESSGGRRAEKDGGEAGARSDLFTRVHCAGLAALHAAVRAAHRELDAARVDFAALAAAPSTCNNDDAAAAAAAGKHRHSLPARRHSFSKQFAQEAGQEVKDEVFEGAAAAAGADSATRIKRRLQARAAVKAGVQFKRRGDGPFAATVEDYDLLKLQGWLARWDGAGGGSSAAVAGLEPRAEALAQATAHGELAGQWEAQAEARAQDGTAVVAVALARALLAHARSPTGAGATQAHALARPRLAATAGAALAVHQAVERACARGVPQALAATVLRGVIAASASCTAAALSQGDDDDGGGAKEGAEEGPGGGGSGMGAELSAQEKIALRREHQWLCLAVSASPTPLPPPPKSTAGGAAATNQRAAAGSLSGGPFADERVGGGEGRVALADAAAKQRAAGGPGWGGARATGKQALARTRLAALGGSALDGGRVAAYESTLDGEDCDGEGEGVGDLVEPVLAGVSGLDGRAPQYHPHEGNLAFL
jgi:hypothetical protein